MPYKIFRCASLIGLLAASVSLTPLAVLAAAQMPGAESHAGMTHGMDGLPTELKLTPDQQALFEHARSHAQEVMSTMRTHRRDMATQTQAVLAQAHPDLATLAAKRDQMESDNASQRKSLQQEWLGFYNSLSPEQVAILKPQLLRMMGMMDGKGPHKNGPRAALPDKS